MWKILCEVWRKIVVCRERMSKTFWNRSKDEHINFYYFVLDSICTFWIILNNKRSRCITFNFTVLFLKLSTCIDLFSAWASCLVNDWKISLLYIFFIIELLLHRRNIYLYISIALDSWLYRKPLLTQPWFFCQYQVKCVWSRETNTRSIPR